MICREGKREDVSRKKQKMDVCMEGKRDDVYRKGRGWMHVG